MMIYWEGFLQIFVLVSNSNKKYLPRSPQRARKSKDMFCFFRGKLFLAVLSQACPDRNTDKFQYRFTYYLPQSTQRFFSLSRSINALVFSVTSVAKRCIFIPRSLTITVNSCLSYYILAFQLKLLDGFRNGCFINFCFRVESEPRKPEGLGHRYVFFAEVYCA